MTELALIAGRYKMPEVYVRSSNSDRALQSAQMLVLGLYPLGTGPNPSIYDKSLKAAPAPELAFTPVPIHAVALTNDSVMRPWTGKANCTKYRKYVKSLRRTPAYKKQAKKYKKFLKRMSAMTGSFVRHSVISPKYNPPKVKVDWPMGYKQLTAVGMRHMYEAGQALRRKYVTELALIAGRYKMPEVYVRSSNTDRALQSAQMLLLGLYPLGTGPNPSIYDKSLKAAPAPELAFTPVPIHAVALTNDSVMRPWTGKANCTKYRKYVKSLRRTPAYKKQAKKYKKFLKRMSAITGVNEGKKTRYCGTCTKQARHCDTTNFLFERA